ncbi:MAG TPA: hypothetical protein VFU05_11705 [Cyclobacteriaceae bacterium]|nr:hypothetical protein [Cyclobacteriaceae bacterium]
MTKIFVIVSTLFISYASAQVRNSFNNLNIKEDSILASTNSQLSAQTFSSTAKIDGLIKSNPEKLELFAILEQSETPVKVLTEEWPAGVIVSINILRDSQGKIIYSAEYPTSESGDWAIGYHHYFDENGNTFAFKRAANFFNTECTQGIAKEQSLYFFKANLSLIEKRYGLSDENGNDLSKKKMCFFNYDYEYLIRSNNKELLK